jgi:hypothetical protein
MDLDWNILEAFHDLGPAWRATVVDDTQILQPTQCLAEHFPAVH